MMMTPTIAAVLQVLPCLLLLLNLPEFIGAKRPYNARGGNIHVGTQESASLASMATSHRRAEAGNPLRQRVRQCARHMVPPLGTVVSRSSDEVELPVDLQDIASLIQIKVPKTGSTTLSGILRTLSLTRPEFEVFAPVRLPEDEQLFRLDAEKIVPWCNGLVARLTGQKPSYNMSHYDGHAQRQQILKGLNGLVPSRPPRTATLSNTSTSRVCVRTVCHRSNVPHVFYLHALLLFVHCYYYMCLLLQLSCWQIMWCTQPWPNPSSAARV